MDTEIREAVSRALAPPPPLLYTVEEAAERLRLSRAKVFQLIRDGLLPSVLVGRSRRIRHDDMQSFVEGL